MKLKPDSVRACEESCETSSWKETCGLGFMLLYKSTRGRLAGSAATTSAALAKIDFRTESPSVVGACECNRECEMGGMTSDGVSGLESESFVELCGDDMPPNLKFLFR